MDFLKKNIVTIVLFLLTAIGGYTWTLIQKGSEATINEKIDARVMKIMTSPVAVKRFLSLPEVKGAIEEAKREAREEALKEDEGLVNFETRVSMEMGVFPDISSKEIGKMYKDYLKRKSYQLMQL